MYPVGMAKDVPGDLSAALIPSACVQEAACLSSRGCATGQRRVRGPLSGKGEIHQAGGRAAMRTAPSWFRNMVVIHRSADRGTHKTVCITRLQNPVLCARVCPFKHVGIHQYVSILFLFQSVLYLTWIPYESCGQPV